MSNGFHIGEKVVCVDATGAWTIVKGRVYTVLAVVPICCGQGEAICVDAWRAVATLCSECGIDYADGRNWKRSTRFRPLEEDSATATLARDEAQRADKQEQQFKPEPA